MMDSFASMVIDILRVDLLGGLVIATVLGGLIGLERELSGKPAGLRTNILICVGATLITDLSMDMAASLQGDARADGSRLAAQIVSGIGFLGAGTIIQGRGMVSGLTSAATLWVVAAIGIAVGSKHWVEAVGTGLLVLLVLLPLGAVERRIERQRTARRILVELTRTPGGLETLREAVENCGLHIRSEQVELDGELLRVKLDVTGGTDAWNRTTVELASLDVVRSSRVM